MRKLVLKRQISSSVWHSNTRLRTSSLLLRINRSKQSSSKHYLVISILQRSLNGTCISRRKSKSYKWTQPTSEHLCCALLRRFLGLKRCLRVDKLCFACRRRYKYIQRTVGNFSIRLTVVRLKFTQRAQECSHTNWS
jgi:hypothetical protein